jgi:hypothetical protein
MTGESEGAMSPDLDARELHRVITASVRELLETARLEAQAGMVDDAPARARYFPRGRPRRS